MLSSISHYSGRGLGLSAAKLVLVISSVCLRLIILEGRTPRPQRKFLVEDYRCSSQMLDRNGGKTMNKTIRFHRMIIVLVLVCGIAAGYFARIAFAADPR